MKKSYFLVALCALAAGASGCKSTERAQAVSIAERICEIDSLRAQRDEQIETARNLAIFGFDSNNQSEERSGSIIVNDNPPGPQTEITELVRAFEIDLDAAYQFAATSCQAHAMCMQMNAHKEGRCSETRVSWSNAQERFVETSADLGDIRGQIASYTARPTIIQPDPRRRHTRSHDHRTQHHYRQRERCRDDIGDMFTTNRCID